MKPLDKLRLSSAEAATPRRAESITHWLIGVLEATGVDADTAECTIVVSNYDLSAEVRARSMPASAALHKLAAVLRHPLESSARYSDAPDIAAALASINLDIFPSGLAAVYHRKRTRLDSARVNLLRQASEVPSPGAVRGSTQIVSKVLRMGAVTAKKPETVRVLVEGVPREVMITHACDREPLLRALASKAWCELDIDAVWLRKPDGLHLSAERSRVTGATVRNFMSGSQFLDAMRTGAPSLLALDPEAFLSDE